MKALYSLVLFAGIGAFFAPKTTQTGLLLGGDTDGYLSPCGCTKPMSGGIRRRATLIRRFVSTGNTVAFENGSLIVGAGRQDQLKSEAMAEALSSSGVAVIHITDRDAKLGLGGLVALDNLAKGKLIVSTIDPGERLPVQRFMSVGGFTVAGASANSEQVATAFGARDLGLETTMADFARRATEFGEPAVLLFSGTLNQAQAVARSYPFIRLIQYRSTAAPAASPIRIGNTLLVSPGEKGKHALYLSWNGATFNGYRAFPLFPDVPDDVPTSRAYSRYLARVTKERLLDGVSREPTATFAGNKACGSCHTKARDVWMKSQHSGAIATLQEDGHHRDPDCVGCHVVGLNSTVGFRSETETPQLKNVGCESCHGPGASHARDPLKERMGKVGERSCAPCHVKEHSPNFDFKSYWKRIAH